MRAEERNEECGIVVELGSFSAKREENYSLIPARCGGDNHAKSVGGIAEGNRNAAIQAGILYL